MKSDVGTRKPESETVDPSSMAALKEAWRHGYQQAVDALRCMAEEFGDEQTKALIGTLAVYLEEMKP